MKTFSKKLREQLGQALYFAEPEQGRFIENAEGRKIGVVTVDPAVFRYERAVGYAFEVAAMAAEDGSERLLFVRIDSWDPAYRREHPEIDYCIPLAYDGASAAERLRWKIPFGGAWSDTKEVGLIVFDQRWQPWLSDLDGLLAFTNPGAQSGALCRLEERQKKCLTRFIS